MVESKRVSVQGVGLVQESVHKGSFVGMELFPWSPLGACGDLGNSNCVVTLTLYALYSSPLIGDRVAPG